MDLDATVSRMIEDNMSSIGLVTFEYPSDVVVISMPAFQLLVVSFQLKFRQTLEFKNRADLAARITSDIQNATPPVFLTTTQVDHAGDDSKCLTNTSIYKTSSNKSLKQM